MTDLARRRLRLRIAVSLAAITLLIAALLGWATLRWVGSAAERGLDQSLARRMAAVEALPAEVGAAMARSLDELAGYLARHDPDLLARLFEGRPEVADAAVRLVRSTGMDLLDVIDGEGRLVSSAQRPNQAGLVIDRLESLPLDTPVIENGDGATTVVLRYRSALTVGERSLFFIGGRRFDESLLETIALGESACLTDAAGRPLVVVGTMACTAPALARWLRDGQAVAGALRTEAAVFGAATLPGRETRWLVVAIDRREIQPLKNRLLRGFLLLGLSGALVAGLAGLWVARGTSRPVEEMVRAVDAIGAGEADYTFTRQTRDEFEELISAFSRLHRSLGLQQQRARAAERVAAWREVARHVAHEVKNPLVPIRLTVENLQRARAQHPERFDELFSEGTRTILEEVDRLRRMVSEFSEFARMPEPQRRIVNPAPLIDEVATLYSAEPDLEILRRIEDELPAIEVDPDRLSQALKNVVGNAVEAMRGSSVTPGVAKRLEIHTSSDGEWVRIEIADSGDGFSVGEAERIFEPYFTTKSEGTGLGMWITYRIISEHGGVIAAENRPEGGARVVLRLPRARSADGTGG